jgi:DNA-binding SARP family transcriptional activator
MWMDDHDHEHGCGAGSSKISIRLLGGFGITAGALPLTLPPSSQRVLAALALRSRLQDRGTLGALLYPTGRRSHAAASLRTALWRARREVGETLVAVEGEWIRLASAVHVDHQHWTLWARSVTSSSDGPVPAEQTAVEALSQPLLPSWREEWLLLEQQCWDQIRMHALEWLAERYACAGRYVEALSAGMAAVSIEPYRESAHRALIRVFLAEGNSASAVAQYHHYRRLVTQDLGIQPTEQLQALVQKLTHTQTKP